MENLKWQPFEETRHKFGKQPLIGILEKGGMSINTSFNKTYGMGDKRFVALRYADDEKYHYIGLTFSNDENIKGKLRINYTKENYGSIQCVSFFNKHSIDYKNKHKGSYHVEEKYDNTFGKLFVIKIEKQGTL